MAHKAGSRNILRRLYEKVTDWTLKKERVGTDHHGNEFYRWMDRSPNGEPLERREVKWRSEYFMYTPEEIQPQWRMWLRRLRDAPPSEDELAEAEAKSAALRGRVAALEEAERVRRARQAAQDVHAQRPGGGAPDLSRVLQQMGGDGPGDKTG